MTKVNCKLESALNPTTSTSGRRKKRSIDEPDIDRHIDEPVYGSCPPNFEKISDYLCLHWNKDSNGDGNNQTFERAQSYCENKGKEVSLLSITSSDEAIRLWNWLGKYFHHRCLLMNAPYKKLFIETKNFSQQGCLFVT